MKLTNKKIKNIKIGLISVASIASLSFCGLSLNSYATEVPESVGKDAFVYTVNVSSKTTIHTNTDRNNKYTYNYNVDCDVSGSGMSKKRFFLNQSSNVTCEYNEPGVYQIALTGVYPHIALSYSGIISVDQWGTQKWKSMSQMFYRASNLKYVPNSPAPNLKHVKSLQSMFHSATNFNADINNWDVSNIEDFNGMFYLAEKFNKPLNNWNTSNAKDMSSMFVGAYEFNQPLSNWDTSKVEDFEEMFYGTAKFNQDLSTFDLSSAKTDGALDEILGSTSLSVKNYDNTLKSWAIQNPIPNQSISTESKFCDETGRNTLMSEPYNWDISDTGIKECYEPVNAKISNLIYVSGSKLSKVGKISAESVDGSGINYSLVDGDGSEDNELFSIDKDGNLSFIKSPDFNNPIDKGDKEGNNTYSVRVRLASAGDETKFIDKVFVITVEDKKEKVNDSAAELSNKEDTNDKSKIHKELAETGENTFAYAIASLAALSAGISLAAIIKRK